MEASTESSPSSSSLRYIPGLDVARGIAILMVLLDHGLAADQTPYQAHPTRLLLGLDYTFRLGHMGVHLFFILSGFLITGILLDSRTQPDYFRNFYTRRALRILPAYLLMLVVLIATHSITARYIALCLLFLCNMPHLLGIPSEYPALWSLSVEEQFYLFWPLIVRKLSLRGLSLLCIALVLLTPVLLFTLLYCPAILHDIRFKIWAVTDFFAAGALLAIAARLPHLRADLHPKLNRAIAPLFMISALLFSLQHLLPSPTSLLFINLSHSVYLEPWLFGFSGFVLFTLLHPALGTSLVSKPLIFLAKISYGLYLCHPFLFNLINRHWPLHSQSNTGILLQLLLRFLVEATIAIAIAALSRYTIEEFFLRFKPKHPRDPHLYNVAEKIT